MKSSGAMVVSQPETAPPATGLGGQALRLHVATWLLASIAILALLWPTHGAVLGWDEVDYVNAARRGPVANMFEQGSLSAGDFLSFARAKRAGVAPPSVEGYSEDSDPLLLRHYHPPFVPYLMAPFAGAESERWLRAVQMLGALALMGASLFAYRTISPTPSLWGLGAVGILSVWSGRILFETISFHGWTAVWTVMTGALLARYLGRPERRRGLLVCAAVALAAVTLQTGAFVLLGAWACLLWFGRGVVKRWRAILAGTGVVVAAVFVAWPGILLKVSVLKIAALYAYLILRGQEYANVGHKAGGLGQFLLPGVLCALVGLGWLLARERSRAKIWGPMAVIGLAYTIPMLRFALAPTYLLPGLLPLALLVGPAVDSLRGLQLRLPVLAGALATSIMAVRALPADAGVSHAMRADVAWLKDNLRGRDVYADGAHVLDHYLPDDLRLQPVHIAYDEKSLMVRRAGVYRELQSEDLRGRVVLIGSHRPTFNQGGGPALLTACQRRSLSTLVLYDCGP